MSQRDQMLHNIGIVDFVLVDLTLYLDTHSCDKDAIEYFNHYSKLKNQMVKEFSQKYFPITKDFAECNTDWRWGAAPLPWEGGC